MPNDDRASFPEPTATTEPVLTDPIPDDLSTPPTMPEAEEIPEPTPQPTPLQPPPATPVSPEPIPATLPAAKSGSPLVTIILILISISACAASYFFYMQSRALSEQLVKVSQTLENQKTPEPTPTPMVTPVLTPEVTPIASVSGTPAATPSAAPTNVPGYIGMSNTTYNLVFSGIDKVITTAQVQYPSAQLLMITTANATSEDSISTKYWFRQTPDLKKYLYVIKEPGKDLVVVDQQVYVSPDNNIPSLNQIAASNQLGIDLDRAIAISSAQCPTNFECKGAVVSAQFIKANTTVWQITYKQGNKPFVVQIDSATSKILYKSS